MSIKKEEMMGISLDSFVYIPLVMRATVIKPILEIISVVLDREHSQ